MESSLYEPFDIGYVPSLEVESALANLDSQRVWDAAQAGYPLEDYYDAVRAHTFNRTVTNFRGNAVAAVQNSSLFMIPLIIDPEQLASDAATEISIAPRTSERVTTLLTNWAGRKSTVVMLTQTLNYDLVACNDPVAFRGLLNQLGPRTTTLQKVQPDVTLEERKYGVALPEGAPSLQFLTGALVSANHLPPMPCSTANGAYQLASQMQLELRFALEDKPSHTGALTVHLPSTADSAIESGLKEWIDALHAKYRFGKWDALPMGTDRVDVLVELVDSTQETIVIPLRTYQLGVKGLERTLQHVGSLATGLFDRAQHREN